jgi:ubiquinone/menaquinone biosynthesis C-methylase UbiE
MNQPHDEDLAGAQTALHQMTNGYWTTQIIYVAAKLGIADLLSHGPQDLATLARVTQTHAPSLARFLRALGSLGVFRENEQHEYELTTLGRCLVSGSPGALRARAILNGEEWYQGWGGLLYSLRTGEPAFRNLFGKTFFEYLAGRADTAAVFNEAMASSTEGAAAAVVKAYDFSGCRTIVDVGGGTGALLAAILQATPQARGILFDRRSVVAAARELLARTRIAGRCELVDGDFFEAVPSGGDVYVLSWIIHDFDDERSIAILGNCRRVMTGDARLLLIEQVVPNGNQPSLSKLYDLHMLVLAQSGRERRADEYRSLLAAADLRLTRIISTEVTRSVIEAVPG